LLKQAEASQCVAEECHSQSLSRFNGGSERWRPVGPKVRPDIGHAPTTTPDRIEHRHNLFRPDRTTCHDRDPLQRTAGAPRSRPTSVQSHVFEQVHERTRAVPEQGQRDERAVIVEASASVGSGVCDCAGYRVGCEARRRVA
jgi:hypothetical protein